MATFVVSRLLETVAWAGDHGCSRAELCSHIKGMRPTQNETRDAAWIDAVYQRLACHQHISRVSNAQGESRLVASKDLQMRALDLPLDSDHRHDDVDLTVLREIGKCRDEGLDFVELKRVYPTLTNGLSTKQAKLPAVEFIVDRLTASGAILKVLCVLDTERKANAVANKLFLTRFAPPPRPDRWENNTCLEDAIVQVVRLATESGHSGIRVDDLRYLLGGTAYSNGNKCFSKLVQRLRMHPIFSSKFKQLVRFVSSPGEDAASSAKGQVTADDGFVTLAGTSDHDGPSVTCPTM